MSSLKAHKFADLLPLMSPAEYEALKADIAANGQQDDVILYEGKILDGRNRERAVRELGKKLKTEVFKGTEGEALAKVYSKANHRNMSESQKAAAAVNFLPHFEKAAILRRKDGTVEAVPPTCQKLVSGKTRAQMAAILKQNSNGRGLELLRKFRFHCCGQNDNFDVSDIPRHTWIEQILDRMYGPKAPEPASGKSRDLAGGLFGVSGRYVSDAKMVFERDPKLFLEVFEGRLPLTRAKRAVHSKHRSKQLIAKAKLAPTTGDALIITGDVLKETEKEPAKKVSLIFADPPYNIGIDYGKGAKADKLDPVRFIEWTGAWMVECFRLLADNGSLWVLINDEWAADFALLLRDLGFTRRAWVKWYETFGINCSNNFNRTSRHLFYCVKDADNFVFNPEAFTRPSDRQSKYNDPRAAAGGKLWDDVWQIPRLVENSKERVTGFPTQLPLALVEPIVRGCSEPGDHVFDPFTGSGTTAVAAVTNGRKFTGTELNPKFAEMARLRVRAAIAERS